MRLFVAVWPPAVVLDVVAALERPPLDGVRWTKAPQWHVTLHFLGDVDGGHLDALRRALAEVESCAPRVVEVGPATATFGRSILMAPVSGLGDIAAATVAATSSFGQAPDDRPFAGHLTLARSGGRSGSRRPRRPTDVRPLAGQPLAASWTVDEVTLVRSTTAREGARYDVIARFPLLG